MIQTYLTFNNRLVFTCVAWGSNLVNGNMPKLPEILPWYDFREWEYFKPHHCLCYSTCYFQTNCQFWNGVGHSKIIHFSLSVLGLSLCLASLGSITYCQNKIWLLKETVQHLYWPCDRCPQWPSGLATLASNLRLSTLCVGSSPTSDICWGPLPIWPWLLNGT